MRASKKPGSWERSISAVEFFRRSCTCGVGGNEEEAEEEAEAEEEVGWLGRRRSRAPGDRAGRGGRRTHTHTHTHMYTRMHTQALPPHLVLRLGASAAQPRLQLLHGGRVHEHVHGLGGGAGGLDPAGALRRVGGVSGG